MAPCCVIAYAMRTWPVSCSTPTRFQSFSAALRCQTLRLRRMRTARSRTCSRGTRAWLQSTSTKTMMRCVTGKACVSLLLFIVAAAQFFQLYTGLLRSDNFVTRRQSLKVVDLLTCANKPCSPFTTQLLGELLLNRANVQIMMRYVADVNNLMLMMNLLKDSSRSIQYEAFHVFKVCQTTLPARSPFLNNPNRCLLPIRKSPRPLSTSLRSTRRSWSST